MRKLSAELWCESKLLRLYNPAERCGKRFNIGDKDLELALEAGLEHAVVVLDNENPLHSYQLFPTVQLPRNVIPRGALK